MCMWGKPTGMKYMRRFGFRCMAARDLTEAITRYAEESFNPTRGTIEVLELIERDLAPTISMENTLRGAGVSAGQCPPGLRTRSSLGPLFRRPAYPIPLQAELTCRHVPEAELRYTLDGSEPNAGSPLYNQPIQIDRTVTLRAAGFRQGQHVTRVSVAEYWRFPPVPPPPDIHVSDLDPVAVWTGEAKARSYAVRERASHEPLGRWKCA